LGEDSLSPKRKEEQKMPKGFKDIKAWQKADDLAVKVYEATDNFPKDQLYTLTNQMQRAAISVPANIAEGSGRSTIADYLRFLYIARGSLFELE
jgi:four helix bundle protein